MELAIRSLTDALAKAVSVAFHPGFQQYYLVVYLANQQAEAPLTYVLATALLFIFPTSFYLYYKKRVLQEENIYRMQRQHRFWPIATNLFALLGFAGLYGAFNQWQVLSPDRFGVTALGLALIIAFINALAISITQYYKISLHMLGTASSCFIFYVVGGPALFLLILVPALLLVGWARLYLKGHTPPEVYWGSTIGVAYALVILVLLGKL